MNISIERGLIVLFVAIIGGVFVNLTHAAETGPTARPVAETPAVLCGGYLKADCRATANSHESGSRIKVWGIAEVPVYATGSREAPNGILFDPLFALNLNFNLEILPDKKLYAFTDSKFWMQRPGAGITNSAQGNLDFSKRELDFTGGVAWNYMNNLELRLSAYGLNNLNRGASLASPSGFQDGVLVENRYYFGTADKYDLGKLNFISAGYFPTKSLVAANGESFKPSLWARAYLTHDIPFWNSYLYADAQFTAERSVKPRLIELDFGLALRPFGNKQYLEFRVGSDLTADVHDKIVRDLLYAAIRLAY